MPKDPPKPYRSTTPWMGFTPRERKRDEPLPRCPSGTCRRAKICQRAIDGLYCRRTHLSPAEAARKASSAAARPAAGPLLIRTLPANASLEQVEAYRLMSDMLLAGAEAAHARMTSKWKQGALDHLYGPYDPKGVLMCPPPRLYVE